jgi:hypothetical protein
MWGPVQVEKSVRKGPLPPSGPFCADSAFPAGAAGGVTTGRSVGTPPAKLGVHSKMSSVQVAYSVLKGDLELSIRDLERMRRAQAFSQDLRIQLGRCLYELQRARRLAGA